MAKALWNFKKLLKDNISQELDEGKNSSSLFSLHFILLSINLLISIAYLVIIITSTSVFYEKASSLTTVFHTVYNLVK